MLSRCHCSSQYNVCILQFSVLPIPEVVLRSLCRGVLYFSSSLRVSGVSAFLFFVPPAPPPAPPVPLELPLQAPPANSESPLPPMPSALIELLLVSRRRGTSRTGGRLKSSATASLSSQALQRSNHETEAGCASVHARVHLHGNLKPPICALSLALRNCSVCHEMG